jgi:hypothetical protein
MDSCLTAESQDTLLLESDVLKELTPCKFCYRASDWDLKVEDWNGVNRSFSICERCLSIILSKNFKVKEDDGFSFNFDFNLLQLHVKE